MNALDDGSAERRERLERNLRRTLGLAFFQVFLVIMPVAVPFFQSKGLAMQEVFALQALFAFVVLITEVPSGYVADLIGRRQTLIVGAVFAGLGNSLLVVADGFWGLAAFEVALAVGHSLVSGADIAMLYDTDLALQRDGRAQRQVVGRLYAVRTLSEASAAVLCSVLLLWSMDVAVYTQAVIGWIPLLLALRLVEPPVQQFESAGHLQNLALAFRYLRDHSRVLSLVLLSLCFWSLTTFYAVWLLQKVWELQGVELSQFGVLWALLSIAAALAGRWAHAVEARLGASAALALVGLAPAVGYLALDLLGPAGAFAAGLCFWVARGIGLVILQDALNRRVPSRFRATANSLASFGFRGAFVVTGPLVGYVLDVWGMTMTLWLLVAGTLVIFGSLILPLILAVRAQGPVPEPAA